MFKGVILYLNRMPQKVVPEYKVMFTFIIKNRGYLILGNEEEFVQKNKCSSTISGKYTSSSFVF